jgi:dihydrofolate reductase
MSFAKIALIVAMDDDRGIGFEGGIPWTIPEDQKLFKSLTSGHVVIMGRKTYDSLPVKSRPLPARHNVVISRSPTQVIETWNSVAQCLKHYREQKNIPAAMNHERIWVIGGGEVYAQALPLADEIYLSRVPGKHGADAHFPPFEQEFKCLVSEQKATFTFEKYQRSS